MVRMVGRADQQDWRTRAGLESSANQSRELTDRDRAQKRLYESNTR
jgi:hypothetical protein